MNKLLEDSLKHHRNHINDNDECFLLKEYIYNNHDNITYSVIIPIYNQEKIVEKNIKSIISHTGGSFEIIIILDFCNDKTEEILINFFDNYNNNNNLFHSVKIFKQPNSPIFEASCDNIGFINSKGKFCLEIQADMEMNMKDYNLYLSKPFNLLPNVFAVSGRCTHNLFRNGGIGKLGTDIEKSIEELNLSPNNFYVHETCNRGPLLFDKRKLIELNYLDEKNYHLDNSDHDIMARAYLQYNYICGYVPINFLAPLCDGTTRNTEKDIYKDINTKYKLLRIQHHEIKNNTRNLISGNTIEKYRKYFINKNIKNIKYDISNISPLL